MRQPKVNDHVRLTRDIPNMGLHHGESGIVCSRWSDPTLAFEVEFHTTDPDDVIPDGSGDPRGWWADDPEHRIGSRLWLLTRSKRTQETLLRAQDYAQEALQWMLDDGVVAKWDVLVEWTAQNTLGVQVTARRTDGRVEAMNFAWAWAN